MLVCESRVFVENIKLCIYKKIKSLCVIKAVFVRVLLQLLGKLHIYALNIQTPVVWNPCNMDSWTITRLSGFLRSHCVCVCKCVCIGVNMFACVCVCV